MNKAITILSYCDTDRKKKMLKSLMFKIKRMYPERPILVYSHYADLEFEYYREADYYIYDRSNPKSERFYYDWTYMPTMKIKFCRSIRDWGGAVLQMVRRSAIFLDSIGVESSLYLNYDSEIEGDRLEMIEYSETIEDDTLALSSKWSDEEHFGLQCFWLDIKKIGIGFFKSLSPERYESHDGVPEKIFKSIFQEEIEYAGLPGEWYKILHDIDISGKISGGSKEIDEDSDLGKYLPIVFPTRLESKKILAGWGSNREIESISAKIDGEYIEIANEFDDKRFFLGRIPEHDIKEIDIVSVNSESISSYKIVLDDSYWSLNWCETDADYRNLFAE